MTKRKKWALGVLGCAAFFCAICGVGGYAAFNRMFGSAASSLPAQIEAAKKEGLPLTAADLRAMNRVAPQNNAAPLYRELFALMKDPRYAKKVDLAVAALGLTVKPEKVRAGRQALGDLGPVIAAAERAAAKPACGFNYQWEQGMNLLLPEFADMRKAAKMLCAEAEARSAAGEPIAAFKTLALARRISHHAGAEPILIAMLVQVSIEATADSSAHQVLARHSRAPHAVSAAKGFFDSFGPLPELRRAMGGEVVTGRITIRQLKTFSELQGYFSPNSEPGYPLERQIMGSPRVKDAFESRLLQVYREIFKMLPRDPENWDAAADGFRKIQTKVEQDRSVSNILNQILMPIFDDTAVAVGQMIARRRVSQCAGRLLEMRLRGGLPTTLPNWGKTSADPFTGSRLAYRREGAGFIVYSVGRDGNDDGGVRSSPTHSGRDVIARYR